MAEGINRPMQSESFGAWSARVAKLDPPPDRFELAKALSEELAAAFEQVFHVEAVGHFEVHVRRQSFAIVCLKSAAYSWDVLQTLARKGFGGRTVTLEKGWFHS